MSELSFVLPDSLWHPSSVAARATLFGVPFTPIATSRVLEVDCADGGNLLSIAASLPESTCVGVSGSATGAESGRALAEAAGLGHVTILTDLNDIEGSFDYIFLRNQFSRIDPAQRSELIASYRDRLSEHGILIVDLVCQPGWGYLEPIREQLRYHTRNIADPHEKMLAGRQFLAALAQSIPNGLELYRAMAESEWKSSMNVPDANFALEYFSDDLHPCYFREFNEALTGAGMQYLCELSIGSMKINQFPQALGAILPENHGLADSEQYLDFATNRTRRNSLLCRDSVVVDRAIKIENSSPLYFSVLGLPDDPNKVFAEEETVLNGPGGASVTIKTKAGKAALLTMSLNFPKRFSLPELFSAVEQKLGELTDEDKSYITETIVACAVLDIVQIDANEGNSCFELSDRPVAAPLVRAQLATGQLPYLSSLQHRSIGYDQVAAALLTLLDGTNGRDALVGKIKEMIASGDLSVTKDGEATTDEEVIAQAAEQRADAFLTGFLSSGLISA
ncbi:MAG: class I SAM-dependent methyltransferase [Verrucomicrobiales bacterium]|nr:class I SAM-dependent methyltransferase [Verrucomicrobiales bacterium]